MKFVQLISILVTLLCPLPLLAYEVIYAINAGGDAHIDSNGVKYSKDPLMGKTGTASDYGKQLMMINRVKPSDEILYQTERYHSETFGYDIRIGEKIANLKTTKSESNNLLIKIFQPVMVTTC